MSTVFVACRVILFIGAVLTSITNQRTFVLSQWAARTGGILWHLLVIGLGWKFPLIFCELHAPLLVPSYCLNLLNIATGKITILSIINNVIGFNSF